MALPAVDRIGGLHQTVLFTDSPCSNLRATVSEDNAALGSLQASPQEPGQTTGVTGARSAFLDVLEVREVLVESENQRGGRNDLRERNRESGETFGQTPNCTLYSSAAAVPYLFLCLGHAPCAPVTNPKQTRLLALDPLKLQNLIL
ncbi:UNVERIFIED_CONTAM: hypothetical protein FKN15_035620 [Acipenser sinensis]